MIPAASEPYPDIHGVLSNGRKLAYAGAFRAIGEYARAMGVTVQRSEVRGKREPKRSVSVAFPGPSRDGEDWHPWRIWAHEGRAETAFNAETRAVIWAGDPRRAAVALLHEVTHARFGLKDGPEHEWSSGMIPFELAWIDRLEAGNYGRDVGYWAGLWREYAYDGRPKNRGSANRAARRAVVRLALPDPWKE